MTHCSRVTDEGLRDLGLGEKQPVTILSGREPERSVGGRAGVCAIASPLHAHLVAPLLVGELSVTFISTLLCLKMGQPVILFERPCEKEKEERWERGNGGKKERKGEKEREEEKGRKREKEEGRFHIPDHRGFYPTAIKRRHIVYSVASGALDCITPRYRPARWVEMPSFAYSEEIESGRKRGTYPLPISSVLFKRVSHYEYSNLPDPFPLTACDPILSYLILLYRITSYRIAFHRIVSYRVLSHPILSFPSISLPPS